jgi:DNA modification methylase
MNQSKVMHLPVFEFIDHVPNDQITAIWTDPPYPIDDNRFKDKYKLMTHEELLKVMVKLKPKLIDGGGLFWMSNQENLRWTWSSLESAGWRVLNIISWNKAPNGFAGHIAPGRYFLNCIEYVFYCCRPGDKPTPVLNQFNYLGDIPPHNAGATTKPAKLPAHCLRAFDHEEAVFCDPFAGSNPVLRAQNLQLLQGTSITNAYVTGENDPARFSPNPELGLMRWIQ